MSVRNMVLDDHRFNLSFDLIDDDISEHVYDQINWRISPLPLAVRNSMINELDDWSELNGLHS